MNPHPLAATGRKVWQSERFKLLRRRKETAASWLIAIGGVGVVCAMVLLLFYLIWVVLPLFLKPSLAPVQLGERSAWSAPAPLLAIHERGDAALRVGRDGMLEFFPVTGLEPVGRFQLPFASGVQVRAAAQELERSGLLALAADSGEVVLLEFDFERPRTAQDGSRTLVPELVYPFGDEPRYFAGEPIDHVALVDRPDRLLVATLSGSELVIEWSSKQTDLLSGAQRLDARLERRELDFSPTGLVLDGGQRWAYVGDENGVVHRFTLPELTPSGQLSLGKAPLTAMTSLLGGVSLIIGDARGRLYQAFPVRDEQDQFQLQLIREFPALGSAIDVILPERRRRGFVATDQAGTIGFYHSTAGSKVLQSTLPGASSSALALAPRADQLLQIDGAGMVHGLLIDNPHPEVSFATLWQKVWYENYPEPQFVWQSTAANEAFEPKLSLAPLAFGTLKASFYAMIFAVPIALLGATYTAVFMAPALRRKIKPTIELMAALPTVILGFLAGLWLAPFVEQQLAGLFAMTLVLPLGLLLFAFAWSRPPVQRRLGWLRGWEPLLLLPVMVALGLFALWVAPPLQQLIFGGDLRDWLSQEAGVSFDQRNAIVVGVAMGFSIIPIIFSIAEDALYAVPGSLTDGSLALGATRWQSLVRIVLPTASPGIFSGLMIGLGRAVGETMIVLMATGNTPIMNFSLFEGMRTLAANIAIEMPESAVASTHFRVLFLSALVLFVFTFLVNTVAELIRQRLRDRYASF